MNLRNVAAAAVIVLAANAVVVFPFAARLDGLSIDSLFWLRDAAFGPRYDPSSSPVVVVALDEETYRRPPFQDLPRVMWTRQIAAVMNAVLAGGAGVIGFDIIFPTSVERNLRGYDRDFLITLRKASRKGRVVLGKVQHQQKPISPFAGYSFAVGHQRNIRAVNMVEDDDGIIRRVPLMFRSADLQKGQRVEPSMSMEVAARAAGQRPVISRDGGISLNGFPLTAPGDWTLAVNFDGGGGSIPTYSLADLFACTGDGNTEYFANHFRDKVVLIGAVLDVEDRKLTSKRFITTPEGVNAPDRCKLPPMPGLYRTGLARDTIPGVYVQAAAINNILRHDPLRRLGALADTGIGLLLTLAAAVPIMLLAPLWAGIAVLAGVLVWAAAATGAFQTGLVLSLYQPLAAALLTFAALEAYRFGVSDKDKRYLRQAFGLYLPPAVVDRLVASNAPPALGGEIRELTVLFSDIVDFTAISEKLSPQSLVAFLNDYFSIMTGIIEAHGGFVDKYIGDAVVAMFGAPLPDPDHARHAVEAALVCQARLDYLRGGFGLPGDAAVATRIGINSGEMLVGNIGSERRFNYTVMGDAVNLASRLEGANTLFRTRILISDRTRELCGDAIEAREIDTVRVVGREKPVTLFEPITDCDDEERKTGDRLATYKQALTNYRAGRFETAEKLFSALAAAGDGPAAAFLKRIQELKSATISDDWDGVTNLDSK